MTPKPKLKYVGFYIKQEVYDRAVAELKLNADTVSEHLVEHLSTKAEAHDPKAKPRKATELDLARMVGKSRATVAKMRAAGELDGLWHEKGRRIVYDVPKSLKHFGVEAS